MQIPAAEFIEMAKDQLLQLDQATRNGQRKELHVATGDASADFVLGYELGIQTARVCQAMGAKV